MTKAEKAAEKARVAAEKTQKALDARAKKVTEPAKDPLADPNIVPVGGDEDEPQPKKVKEYGAQTNTLAESTKGCMATIIRTAESTMNHNPVNIQDAICSIIRQAFSAYNSHVGHPFDPDLG